MVAHVPFCHCGCGKKCYPANIERGYAAALDLQCGTVYFARKVVCAEKFAATRRPDLKDEILASQDQVDGGARSVPPAGHCQIVLL